MNTKRKYRPGRAFTTVQGLARATSRGEYVYMRHKPQHPRWIECLTFQTVLGGVAGRIFRRAIPLVLCLALAGCAAYQEYRKEATTLGAVLDFAIGAASLATGDPIGAAVWFSSGAITLGGEALKEAKE